MHRINEWKRKLPLEIVFASLLILSFWLPRIYFTGRTGSDLSVFSLASLKDLFLFDLVVLGYFLIPWLLIGLVWPKSRQPLRWAFRVYLGFALLLAFFAAVAEFFFIEEFLSRYNFIAIDYLVYTSEVLKNIWESYPIVPIVGGLLVFSIGLTWFLSGFEARLGKRAKVAAILIFAGLFFLVQEDKLLNGLGESQREFSKNGFHALFAAYRNNQIDFEKFYTTLPRDTAFEIAIASFARISRTTKSLGAKRTQKSWSPTYKNRVLPKSGMSYLC